VVGTTPADRVSHVSGSALSRRRVLSAAGLSFTVAGAGLLGGCRFDPPSPTPVQAPATPDPDASILAAAHAELTTLINRLSASTGAATLVACHRAQLIALGGQVPPVTARARSLTPTAVVVRERRAVTRFTHWAVTCNDGDLAMLLASVAAGIRMQPALQGAP
jgi:hypothetical protein